MKGSIRFILGLLIVFGGVGGIETNEEILAPVIASIVGLVIMASGVKAMNGGKLFA